MAEPRDTLANLVEEILLISVRRTDVSVLCLVEQGGGSLKVSNDGELAFKGKQSEVCSQSC